MRKKTVLLIPAMITTALSCLTLGACGNDASKDDVYTKDGKLVIEMRNLYFNDYAGGDTYLEEISDKFQISFELTPYSWTEWGTQVNSAVLADNVEDVFHADIDSYNFATKYKYWADEMIAKQLPDDLSKWPHLKEMIDNTTNIDSLKINGHLYGIPIAKNTSDYSTSYSPFTYAYRRDWAKEWGVYQENDEYTWEQFTNLLDVFTKKGATEGSKDRYALADVEWGFPSVVNFYKEVPHCFVKSKSTGQYVNNYTTDEYLAGLQEAKTFREKQWYGFPQYSAVDGDANKQFVQNKAGVLYENLSYSNFVKLRNDLKNQNALKTTFNVDEALGIMKIKGQDGKYALEGTDNWFSMTFLDYKMSDTKMNKILDLFDWLLSEEGTTMAVYGREDYDYIREDGQIKIVEKNWPKDSDGNYADKINGAKYLRYMVSLGYDTIALDPLTDKKANEILEDWDKEMKSALDKNELRVLKEDAEVMWLTTDLKAKRSEGLRTSALQNVMRFIYQKEGLNTINDFKNSVTNSTWTSVLEEINKAVKK